MTDIVERLHIPVVIPRGSITCVITDQLRVDIIAEIERLRALNAELLAALKCARELIIPERYPRAHALIRAAIAKAEGRA